MSQCLFMFLLIIRGIDNWMSFYDLNRFIIIGIFMRAQIFYFTYYAFKINKIKHSQFSLEIFVYIFMIFKGNEKLHYKK